MLFAPSAADGLSVKRTDLEAFREAAAEKSALREGSLGEVMLEGSEGLEPWNCAERSENCVRRRSSESACL